MSHTPGPWKPTVRQSDGDIEITDSKGSVLATAYGDDNDPNCWPVSANARLIAEAPDLLEALRQIEKAESHHGSGPHCTCSQAERLKILRAAIAKVGGF